MPLLRRKKKNKELLLFLNQEFNCGASVEVAMLSVLFVGHPILPLLAACEQFTGKV